MWGCGGLFRFYFFPQSCLLTWQCCTLLYLPFQQKRSLSLAADFNLFPKNMWHSILLWECLIYYLHLLLPKSRKDFGIWTKPMHIGKTWHRFLNMEFLKWSYFTCHNSGHITHLDTAEPRGSLWPPFSQWWPHLLDPFSLARQMHESLLSFLAPHRLFPPIQQGKLLGFEKVFPKI